MSHPSSSAGKLLKEFPERCFNFGIAEPDQVGASAGLALSGCTVFSQVFGPFLPLRAADQIHTDIAYNDVNVRLIGTHSGVTAGGGPTHNDIADLALYRAIPNLTVVVPGGRQPVLQVHPPVDGFCRPDDHSHRPCRLAQRLRRGL